MRGKRGETVWGVERVVGGRRGTGGTACQEGGVRRGEGSRQRRVCGRTATGMEGENQREEGDSGEDEGEDIRPGGMTRASRSGVFGGSVVQKCSRTHGTCEARHAGPGEGQVGVRV